MSHRSRLVLNEMGITNPEFPEENCPQGNCSALAFNPRPDLNDDGTGVTEFTDFMTLLAPPPRANLTLQVHDGRATSLDAAILAHDGQGSAAGDRFLRLSPRGRFAVLQFLRRL